MKKLIFILIFITLLTLIVSVDIIENCTEPVNPPLTGEALWETLPPELLSNVAEGIREQISDLEDDLAKVQEIQRRYIG